MKAIRIYYDNTGKIIYHIGLEGNGNFPKSAEDELSELPPDTKLLEVSDSQLINDYLIHEGNSIDNGQLILGTPAKAPPPPTPRRNLAQEIDELKGKLLAKGIDVS